MSTHTLHLDLLGERILVEAAEESMLPGVRRAAILFLSDDETVTPELTFTFRYVAEGDDEFEPGGALRAVSEQKDFEIYGWGDDMDVVVERRSVARCRFGEGTVDVRVHPDHRGNDWIAGHRLFFIPLLEWMRHRNWYPVHGSCFRVDGRTVVVTGPSGCGKSTAALSAIAAGCPVLSDDTLFARREGRIIRLDAFPEPIKIGRGSGRFFPEWLERFEETMGKLALAEGELPGGCRLSGVTPDYLLFPEITGEEKTRFRPMEKEAALIRLLPQSVLPEGAEVMQRHIDLLGEMVEQTETYYLLFGRDARHLPDRIRDLL